MKAKLSSLDPLYTDLHMHTRFCDGHDTPRDMVEAAIEAGLTTVGVLAHSYVDFDRKYSIDKEDIPRFIKELRCLAEEYRDEITVLVGLEEDYYTTYAGEGFDYKIGSAHYFKIGDEYLSFDQSKAGFIEVVKNYFGGDFYSAVEEYYRLVGGIVERTGADIVGHFDLITKYNAGGDLFDTYHPRYIAAYRAAADRLIESGALFEINTGAISRGYTERPYPAPEVYKYIKDRGGRFIFSSDAHVKENVAFRFDLCEWLINTNK